MAHKILYIIGSLDRGGAETHLLKILPALQKREFDISVFLLARRGVLADEFEAQNIKLIEPWVQIPAGSSNKLIRIFRLLAVSVQLALIYLFSRPKLVHFFLPASYWIGGSLACLFSRARKIMSRRSMNHYMQDGSMVQRLEAALHPRMDFVLGNSQAVVDQLLEEGAPSEKVGLIHNGIELSEVSKPRQVVRSEFNIPDDMIVMTIVANLIPYKGHADLIEALAKVKNAHGGNWKLLCVGRDDGIEKNLREQAANLGLDVHIIFTGSRQDVADIYAASDIGLLVSHEEGFSNAILEGMAASLPMIVTDVGGNAEAVMDDETGFVVPAKDSVLIASVIERLLLDQKLREEMGQKSRLRLEKNFTLNKCVDAYDRLYRDLLS